MPEVGDSIPGPAWDAASYGHMLPHTGRGFYNSGSSAEDPRESSMHTAAFLGT
jgi:hypothetical protein